MTRTTLQTGQDCRDLLEGALWMGTGGGGSWSEGLSLLEDALAEDLCLAWTDAGSIPEDAWTATVGLHGSIAPLTAETLAEIDRLGLTKNTDEWYITRAVEELGAFLGHEFGCLVPGDGTEDESLTNGITPQPVCPMSAAADLASSVKPVDSGLSVLVYPYPAHEKVGCGGNHKLVRFNIPA